MDRILVSSKRLVFEGLVQQLRTTAMMHSLNATLFCNMLTFSVPSVPTAHRSPPQRLERLGAELEFLEMPGERGRASSPLLWAGCVGAW